MTNKILVIFTGGTIGSLARSGVINVDSSTRYEILRLYCDSTGESSDQFDICYPLNLLSENLIPSDWNYLTSEIQSKDLTAYDGIIVTHGTDTLPYTSAILSYTFNQLTIPLVVVASDLPVDNPASNGIVNFTAAVKFIKNRVASGVYAIYRNVGEEPKVHLGSRITEAFPFTHQFRSQKNAFFGTMKGDLFVLNEDNKYHPNCIESIESRESKQIGNATYSDDIVFIKPYPGLNYSLFDFSSKRPKAVLHDLYHSGTACIRNERDGKYSILLFAKRCKMMGIDFYVAPISSSTDSTYITSKELIECGVIPLPDMSIEACLAKLSLAYGTCRTSAEAKDLLTNTEFFFEFIT